MNPLYEALIERDSERAREEARAIPPDELFVAVARFAVLAYAPSQHAKHALLACLAAHEAGASDELRVELFVECALYAAAARLPWSEPPILDPPAADDAAPEGFHERLAAERWLARRWQRDGFAAEYFDAATHDFEDLGHSLIVAGAAWRLASLLGEGGRYALLRTGVWEMASHRGEPYLERGNALDPQTLAAKAIDACVAAGGEVVSAHAVFLLDAALQCGDSLALRRVCDHLTATTSAAPTQQPTVPQPSTAMPALVAYELARDYGATLKAHAVARRWPFPEVDIARFVAAVDHNRLFGASFAEWSFA